MNLGRGAGRNRWAMCRLLPSIPRVDKSSEWRQKLLRYVEEGASFPPPKRKVVEGQTKWVVKQ